MIKSGTTTLQEIKNQEEDKAEEEQPESEKEETPPPIQKKGKRLFCETGSTPEQKVVEKVTSPVKQEVAKVVPPKEKKKEPEAVKEFQNKRQIKVEEKEN